MAAKIAVACEKGGVGKTSIAINLSAILHNRGFRVLLIDCDMQANATDSCGCQFEGETSLFDVLFEGASVSEALQVGNGGFSVLVGDSLLRECEARLSADVTLLGVLRQRLEAVESDFDFIILDTPPGLGNWLVSCLMCADYILTPVSCDRYSLIGLSQMSATLAKIKGSFGREVKMLGVAVVRYNPRLKVSKGIMQTLERAADEMGTKVFDATIREASIVRECQALRQSLIDYAPSAGVVSDYEDLTNEILEVLEDGKI